MVSGDLGALGVLGVLGVLCVLGQPRSTQSTRGIRRLGLDPRFGVVGSGRVGPDPWKDPEGSRPVGPYLVFFARVYGVVLFWGWDSRWLSFSPNSASLQGTVLTSHHVRYR